VTYFRLTRRNVAALRRSLIETLPARPLHVDEALAAGIGYPSHSALMASLRTQGNSDRVTVAVDEGALAERLGTLSGLDVDAGDVVNAFGEADLPDVGPWTELAKLRRREAANEN